MQAEYSISMGTLSRAYARLKHQGYIDTRSGGGGGAFVMSTDVVMETFDEETIEEMATRARKDLSSARKVLSELESKLKEEVDRTSILGGIEAVQLTDGRIEITIPKGVSVVIKEPKVRTPVKKILPEPLSELPEPPVKVMQPVGSRDPRLALVSGRAPSRIGYAAAGAQVQDHDILNRTSTEGPRLDHLL